ncbi:MAG: Gfo/Idh/MocA family protein, partial [Chloroflexota bacterium]
VAVALQHRVMEVYQEMRRIVRSGALGEIREVRGRPTVGPRGGSFLLTVLGTHILDLMRDLAGDPFWVFGRVTTREGREVVADDARPAGEAYGLLAGDAVGAIYGFANGITGFCDSYDAPAAPEGSMSVEVHGTEGIAALRSTATGRGLFRWEASSGRPIQDLTRVPVAGWDDDPRQNGPGGMSLDLLNHRLALDLIDAIERDREPMASGADGRWAMEMIFGVHESQLSGARVPLPCAQRENPYQARGLTPCPSPSEMARGETRRAERASGFPLSTSGGEGARG